MATAPSLLRPDITFFIGTRRRTVTAALVFGTASEGLFESPPGNGFTTGEFGSEYTPSGEHLQGVKDKGGGETGGLCPLCAIKMHENEWHRENV
jgi:hypothetical protein